MDHFLTNIASWINCLVDNYTVEEYLKVSEELSPREAVWAVGYSGRGRYNKNKMQLEKVVKKVA